MNSRSEFIKLFKSIAPYNNRYEVFSDAVSCFAYSLHNAVKYCDELEKEYLQRINRYEKEDRFKIKELFHCLVDCLEVEPTDFLGGVFMELELGNSNIGQFFTPFSVSLVMARLNIGEVPNRFITTLHDPAVGSAGLPIAYATVLREKGVNVQEKLWVQGIDIDHTAAMMAYVQLSLLGISGEIIVGNSLTIELGRVYRTPTYYVGNWASKLKFHYAFEKIFDLIGEGKRESIATKAEVVEIPPTPVKPEQFDLLLEH